MPGIGLKVRIPHWTNQLTLYSRDALHNGAHRTTGVYLYLFLHTATLKAHWGSSSSEGPGGPERLSLPGGPEDKIDQDRYSKEGPYEAGPAHTFIALLLVSFFCRLMKPPLRSRSRLGARRLP